jgi:hypothetical protein
MTAAPGPSDARDCDGFVTVSAQTRALFSVTLIPGGRARKRPRGEEVDARGNLFPLAGGRTP